MPATTINDPITIEFSDGPYDGDIAFVYSDKLPLFIQRNYGGIAYIYMRHALSNTYRVASRRILNRR